MIVFFSNSINQHQVLIADQLFLLTNKDYVFVETTKVSDERTNMGFRFFVRTYQLKAYESEEAFAYAMQIAREADVAIFGANSLPFQIERMKLGKLSFEVSERWLKRGWLNLLSPRLLKNMWYYHTLFYDRPLYKLCASAYAAEDQYRLHSFKDRCYKWGYFTKVEDFDVETHVYSKFDTPIKLMWCARFLDLKHPELVVELARKLKENSHYLSIDMFGSGVELEKTKKLCQRLGVEDMITFKGNVSNEEILHEMRDHDIFLFTSDKKEGWGAVLSEAMSNGCAVVASNEIGSVPFLVKDGENGIVFKSKDVNSLYNKVVWLIEHPKERKDIAIKAYYTMKYEWSPEVAARNLLTLIGDLQNQRDTSIKEGPCSKAL